MLNGVARPFTAKKSARKSHLNGQVPPRHDDNKQRQLETRLELDRLEPDRAHRKLCRTISEQPETAETVETTSNCSTSLEREFDEKLSQTGHASQCSASSSSSSSSDCRLVEGDKPEVATQPDVTGVTPEPAGTASDEIIMGVVSVS